MRYIKPNSFYYRFAQLVAWPVAACIFKRKVLRNEIKGVDGPFVVIANHQAAYDFVNLIGICKRRMSFVISNSFYQSLPIRGFLDKLAVIPKQQFQTNVSDMKKIRAVIEAGEPLVIYPAGLMCEDGLSTPIPNATYKLFKWLGVDVYMAKTCGTYFAMPKWANGFRPGKTTLDVYKLFSKEELETLSPDAIRERAENALLFDAYREQEQLLVKYKNGADVHGLQNVLYTCPHCGTEFSIVAQGESALVCERCGYRVHADEYGFLHKDSAFGPELRYVSDWSRRIYAATKEKLARGEDAVLTAKTAIHMIDRKKKKYQPVGEGTVTLTRDKFLIEGTIHGERVCLNVPSSGFPSLPFAPGKHIEIQDGQTIYRCVLEDGRLAMKFINMIKIFYQYKTQEKTAATV
ncbi:MAG: 1-acyl-sn-glycerol-3-phosphate acyltransferase [Clostridia bacterium]|nr:1-acyl-sn-glycerol-3-phosphate acyltransferase [Clostridia bacterium]